MQFLVCKKKLLHDFIFHIFLDRDRERQRERGRTFLASRRIPSYLVLSLDAQKIDMRKKQKYILSLTEAVRDRTTGHRT